MAQISNNNRLAGISHHQLIRRRFVLLECAAFAIAVAVLVSILRKMLFSGQTTMTHDTVLWVYPVFTYLADGILHGRLPLWNPFSRAGEPLFFAYLQMRLFDPVDYLVIYLGAVFTNDLTTLFHWDRLVRLLLSALGVHLLLRRWAKHPVTRMVLPFVAVLSSMTTNGFHQPGFSDQFYCSPFLAICVFRILEGRTGWANWLAAVFFFGQCLQSYFFVGPITFVLFIVVAYALFRRPELTQVLRNRGTWLKASVCILFLMAMSSLSLIGSLQQKNYYTPARSIPPNWEQIRENTGTFQYDSGGVQVVNPKLTMPYGYIRLTGTPSRPAELLGLLASKEMDLREVRGYPMTGEARLFIGGLAFVVSLVGIFLARHPFKPIWLTLLVGFGTLMLGPYTPVHWLLYLIYPSLWVIRHTEQFINYFLLALLFFFVLGSDLILTIRQRKLAQWPDLRVLSENAGRIKAEVSELIRAFARWLERAMQTRSGRIAFRWRYPAYLLCAATVAIVMYRFFASLAAIPVGPLQIGQFPILIYALAVLVAAATAYARRFSMPLSEAIDRSVFCEWYRRLWALVASIVAIDVIVRLSSTGPGVPVQYMSWMPIVTTIAAAVLVLAGITLRRLFSRCSYRRHGRSDDLLGANAHNIRSPHLILHPASNRLFFLASIAPQAMES